MSLNNTLLYFTICPFMYLINYFTATFINIGLYNSQFSGNLLYLKVLFIYPLNVRQIKI